MKVKRNWLDIYCSEKVENQYLVLSQGMGKSSKTTKIKPALSWFKKQKWKPFPFQLDAWEAYLDGHSGLVNAPTGAGKTYSLLMPVLLQGLEENDRTGLRLLWVTPIRALAKEIRDAAKRAIEGLGLDWQVGIRSGDTTTQERKAQLLNPPEILITTPESIHLLLATRHHAKLFGTLRAVVADEWHELMGSKRGVLLELALSRFKVLVPDLRIWGISATIGNMEESLDVLFGSWSQDKSHDLKIVRSSIKKVIDIETIFPDEIETYPWSGHLGIRLIEKVIPILAQSRSTLIFTNTRGQCEIWYQRLLDLAPDLIGIIAMHHGSISREIRDWVEDALHTEKIKAVVCTSSLDLGVDFRPVETIIQIGSPKGVARFVQRAGRSGHQPGATSKIYFLPTNALEIMEGAALKEAIRQDVVEDRIPYVRSYDVLMQYLVTLAVSDGFAPEKVRQEIQSCFSFRDIDDSEWQKVLEFTVSGGSLDAYDEFKKLGKDREGKYRVVNKQVATRHRLSIGTIVGSHAMRVKYLNGKKLGNIEETFITKLNPGDNFWFAGRSLKFVRINGNDALVKKSNSKTGRTPSWGGGRMSLSSELSSMIRLKLDQYVSGAAADPEMQALDPLFALQSKHSIIPDNHQFLIEYFIDKEGHHLTMFPFEGRFVHEGMAALFGYRISQLTPLTFSIAMNDYGFELLSDQPIPIEDAINANLFSTAQLQQDILASVNTAEMARKRFRDIAAIGGLVFRGFPGRYKKERHLQSSSGLLFNVFRDYDPGNLLFLQAYDEAIIFQLEENRLRRALNRIAKQEIKIIYPKKCTPFSFPLIVDRLRERMTNEKLSKRIERMHLQLKGG